MTDQSKLILKQSRLSVMFNVVTIELHCNNDYTAQVLFDDLDSRFKTEKKLTITLVK